MKKYVNIIGKIVLILIIMILISNVKTVNTVNAASGSIDDVMSSADDFLKAGDNANKDYTDMNMDNLKEGSKQIFTLFFVIGSIVAVIVGFILGIQFMVAETESKAKIKETLVVYLVGCVVVFGGFTIWRIIVTIGNQF